MASDSWSIHHLVRRFSQRVSYDSQDSIMTPGRARGEPRGEPRDSPGPAASRRGLAGDGLPSHGLYNSGE